MSEVRTALSLILVVSLLALAPLSGNASEDDFDAECEGECGEFDEETGCPSRLLDMLNANVLDNWGVATGHGSGNWGHYYVHNFSPSYAHVNCQPRHDGVYMGHYYPGQYPYNHHQGS